MQALVVQNLTKYYTSRTWYRPWQKPAVTKAVDRISFEIKEGEIIGLLGPNGAGKTTTTQMLLGTLTPTGGEIRYFGALFSGRTRELLGKINFSSAYIQLPDRMTVWENLDVYARLYQIPNGQERIKRLLNEFECQEFIHRTVLSLSAGQKTRVMLVKAFLNYPRLLLLDEPTASLDPDIAVKVRQFLLKQQKEYQVAMLFTSHNMHEVQEICDRIIFLNHGQIIAQDTPLGLLRKMKKTKVKMMITQHRDRLENYLNVNKISFYWQKEKIFINLKEDQIPKMLYRISDDGVRYAEIEIVRPSLEDFFLEIVGKQDDG